MSTSSRDFIQNLLVSFLAAIETGGDLDDETLNSLSSSLDKLLGEVKKTTSAASSKVEREEPETLTSEQEEHKAKGICIYMYVRPPKDGELCTTKVKGPSCFCGSHSKITSSKACGASTDSRMRTGIQSSAAVKSNFSFGSNKKTTTTSFKSLGGNNSESKTEGSKKVFSLNRTKIQTTTEEDGEDEETESNPTPSRKPVAASTSRFLAKKQTPESSRVEETSGKTKTGSSISLGKKFGKKVEEEVEEEQPEDEEIFFTKEVDGEEYLFTSENVGKKLVFRKSDDDEIICVGTISREVSRDDELDDDFFSEFAKELDPTTNKLSALQKKWCDSNNVKY